MAERRTFAFGGLKIPGNCGNKSDEALTQSEKDEGRPVTSMSINTPLKIAKGVKLLHGWPNATIFTYSTDKDGKWTCYSDQDSTNDQRVIQQGWKSKIVEAAVKKKQLREERVEKRGVEKRGVEKENIKKGLESIEVERVWLDRMLILILLADQAEIEEIQKDWEESTKSVKLETKSEKLKRDLLRSQDSMLAVDSEANEIVTFAEFQVLLKERHAKEFSAMIKPLKDLPETKEPTKRCADVFVDPESSAKKKRIY